MKRILSLLVLFAAVALARAQGPDEQYVQIYQLIQEADRLNEAGQSRAAVAKYIEAQDALTRFRGIYPGWNERVINYRSSYITGKLAPLSAAIAGSRPSAAPGTNTGAPAVPMTNAPSDFVPSPGLTSTTPTPTPPPMSAEYENQIKALQGEVERLQMENKNLGARLKEALSVQPAAMDPRELAKAEERIRNLQKENELFRVQLAQKPVAPSVDLSGKLAEQTEAIAALRAENEVLKKQSADWRQKHDALAAVANAARQDTGTRSAETEAAVRQLSANNLELQKQVELWKQVATKNTRPVAPNTMPREAERELAMLRARVGVMEAKAVPYTAEELALFAKSPPALITNAPAKPELPIGALPPPAEGNLKVTHGIPIGAGALVRSAESAFSARRYDVAEQKYLEILRQDENNVTTVANLASAQLERGNLVDAEKNVQRALQLDPNDNFALYLLGRLRFNQDKLDEALDALSRSVKADPNYADAQNYLGIVLSEKGFRGPAETALRRAVQLQPDFAVAHNNLAVVYAMQKPPALALARWHYKKAREAGHPANAELEKLLQ